jgi:hypothetical protein
MNAESLGMLIISLGSLLGLISIIVKPFKELTDAINGLKILVERLTIGHENIENEVQWHDERIKNLEERTRKIEIECVLKDHH